MTLFDQYGIKEVEDVTLYSIHKKEDGSGDVYYLPALYLDTLKVSTTEQTADNVWATGGVNNSRLINWDFGKTINVTLDDALCTPASLGLCWNGVLSSNWKNGKIEFDTGIDNSINRLSRMEKAKAPRQDIENGTIGNLLPKIKADIVDDYFGVLKTSAVVDGTDIRGFGTTNGHTYKWKMAIESLVKSIAVIPDRFFDVTGRSYRIDQNRKISVNSLPTYDNYKDAVIYKINSSSHYSIPDLPKLIFDEGAEKQIEADVISFTYQSNDSSEPQLITVRQLINKDSNEYKLYDDDLIAKITIDGDQIIIDEIYIPQVSLDTLINTEDITTTYLVHESSEADSYMISIDRDIVEGEGETLIRKGYASRPLRFVAINCELPSGFEGEHYNPIPYNVNDEHITKINGSPVLGENLLVENEYVIFIPDTEGMAQEEIEKLVFDDFNKIFRVGNIVPATIPDTNPELTVNVYNLTDIIEVDVDPQIPTGNEWNLTTTPIKTTSDVYALFGNNFPRFKYAISNLTFNYYKKDLDVYRVIPGSDLDIQIRGTGLRTDSNILQDSLNTYLWNHRVDIITTDDEGQAVIDQADRSYEISKADYLAIIVDNNDNYIPLIGVIFQNDGTTGYTSEELYGENEPLPTENSNQLIWFNPCPMIDVSQFKGIDMWLKFEELNEMIYFLITKYEDNIYSIVPAYHSTDLGWDVNKKSTTVNSQVDAEAQRVSGKLWAYINPRTMTPYPDDYWFHAGEPYYIKSLTLSQGGKKINGQRIVIKADQWPGMYMMVGETWIRSRDTGDDMRLQVKIPLCKVRSDHTLTLQADGEPTVFSLNLEVAEPQNGEMMEITAYEVRTRMVEDADGRLYAVDGSSEVVIE